MYSMKQSRLWNSPLKARISSSKKLRQKTGLTLEEITNRYFISPLSPPSTLSLSNSHYVLILSLTQVFDISLVLKPR